MVTSTSTGTTSSNGSRKGGEEGEKEEGWCILGRWIGGMDPLRELVVQLDFVRENQPGEDGQGGKEVLASSITYVGFVGVLTGVRKGLSASLNFRPVHNDSMLSRERRNLAFYVNHLLVLLGRRQSIRL